MTWAVELSAAAEKDLKRLPRDRQARIEHAIDEMQENPFAGDVKALKGPEWVKGALSQARGALPHYFCRRSQD